MPIKCLYIEGEKTKNVAPLWQTIERAAPDKVSILPQQPLEFEKQIKLVQEDKPDLLILDLRLDENGVSYRGPTLARELRTRMLERNMSPFPIVLWSFSNKLKHSYDLEETTPALFEKIYAKDKEIVSEPQRVAFELKSLVKGYRRIIEKRTASKSKFYGMLGLKYKDARIMDPQIGERFITKKKYPVHEYARYILKEMIEIQGPLVDERILAARLGVDIQSSKDWAKCKKWISKICAYMGAFSEAWPRWWDFKLELWWQSQGQRALHALMAKERVDFLRSITGLSKLVPAKPIEAEYSTRYTTICQGLEKPLDPRNSIWASCAELKSWTELKSWQEPPRLSIKAAVERIGWEKNVRVHPLDVDRLEEIKARGY